MSAMFFHFFKFCLAQREACTTELLNTHSAFYRPQAQLSLARSPLPAFNIDQPFLDHYSSMRGRSAPPCTTGIYFPRNGANRAISLQIGRSFSDAVDAQSS
jgi:hypothetical protein